MILDWEPREKREEAGRENRRGEDEVMYWWGCV